MLFSELSQYLLKINNESSRLAITEILADLLIKATAHEARHISYLSLGTLEPIYKSKQFNFSDKNILKLLSRLSNMTEERFNFIIKETGDLGIAINKLNIDNSDIGLSIEEVYNKLYEIQNISGIGSQEIKSDLLYKLLQEVDLISAQFIIKIILDNMRLGFSDMTFIDALSWLLARDKSYRYELERAYNVCADLGLITLILKQENIAGIKNISSLIGIPIRPAAAERLNSSQAVFDKIGPNIAVQPKLDGFRLQIHINKLKLEPTVNFYSRNLLDMSTLFPDLKEELVKLPVTNLIIEGEAIAFNQETQQFLPFQETIKRKRKHNIAEFVEAVPLKFYIFDILYLDNKSLLDFAHIERRKILENIVSHFYSSNIFLIEERICNTQQELSNYFSKQISNGLEGIIAKKINGLYLPGKRNFNWIKLKRHQQNLLDKKKSSLCDTIDAVILGYYFGQGKRAKLGIGAFLVGVYNKDSGYFETIAKIGTGLTDQEWQDIKKISNLNLVNNKPANINCATELEPDIWVSPEIAVLILADDITKSKLHSSGFSLRFPRFIGYAIDKKAYQATTVKEILNLYNLQFK